MFTRRNAILSTTGLIAVGLVGCTTAQVASTLATLASGWAALPGLLSTAGVTISTAISTQVTAALADLQKNAAAIGTAVGAAPTTVTTIVSDINLVSTLLSPFFPEASVIGGLVGAGVSLVGTLLSEAGITGATIKILPAPYSPAVAMMILRGAKAP